MEPQRSKWHPFNRETFFHFNILCLCLGMALVALILQEQKPEAVVHTLGATNVSTLCLVKRTTGIDCPGCGLTRSFVAAMHGNLAGSFNWHKLGPAGFFFLWAQTLRHGSWLGLPSFRTTLEIWGKRLDEALLILLILLPFNWLLRWFYER